MSAAVSERNVLVLLLVVVVVVLVVFFEVSCNDFIKVFSYLCDLVPGGQCL